VAVECCARRLCSLALPTRYDTLEHTVHTPEELLDSAQPELELMAEEMESESGVDRRQFLFRSLMAAAATTFGAHTVSAQRLMSGAMETAPSSGAAPQQAQLPPYPLGNGEPPAEQFMPYPGGTGALMEKMVREHGASAFNRTPFSVEKWSGAVPTSDEEIAFLPAHRLSALVKAKKITSTRLTKIYLERIKRLNPTLLCAVTIMESQALAEAARADAEIAAGKYRGPLHGLPYGVKDLFNTKGVPTTWGTADFETRIIDDDAEVVVRLRDAGAVLIAKLATGLFAQNDQWFRGRTNNPWNLSQGASGSSAGPASATAAGCVAFGIGTETQGSIVSPSIRCGLSALRPTFGRVSRAGGMVLAWSQDRVGPLCRSVEDCAMVFSVIHGADEKDPSTLTTPFSFDHGIKLSKLRIGVDPGRPGTGPGTDAGAPPELVAKLRELGMDPKVIGARPTVPGIGQGGLNVEYAAAFEEYVVRKAKEIGLDLNTVLVPTTGGAPYPGTVQQAAGAPSPMAPADWNPRFVAGRTVKAFDFLQNQRRRYVLVTKWGEFMKDLDLFIGSPNADIGPNAQTGHPCVVVPYKFDVPQQFGGGRGGAAGAAAAPAPALNAQPICAVITGALYNDDKILSVAHQFQTHNDVYLKHPSL
jgi:Asp-tRNA(Asn)/Glu-tRNA(Gln) amidotransferase A subunit family amidase